MPQDGILPSTDETLSPPPLTYAQGLPPPAGTLPANYLDNGHAAILGTQPGFGNLSVAPPTAPSAGANGAPSPAATPVDASGRSTMPINADPSLYGPGTPGAAANQHFGPGPPTRLTPQQPTGGRASTITPKAEGGAALGSIISFQPSDDFSQQTGISAEDYDRYRGYLAQNESQRYDQPPSRTGKADPPWVAGRYQMGPGEIAQAASELGIPNPSIQQFLGSPELQEQLFQQYTLDHHRELMQYPMYANGDAATRMALLAGRHLGGFDTWIKGGDPQDINGTHTSKYINGMYAVATGKVDGIAHPGAVGAPYSTDPAIQSIQTQLQQSRTDATRLLQTELEEFNKLKAGSPEADAQLRKLADRQIADLDSERQMVMSPPIEKPADIFANFGSLATVVGVLGGMLSRRGMVASLDAAGAAMEAINTNNHEQWKDAFDTWKARTSLMANLIGHESAIYRDILDNKRLDWDEKLGLLQTRFGIEQNILGQQYAAAGDMAKIIEMTQKQQEIADKHRETVAKAEVEENKRDQERQINKLADDYVTTLPADMPKAQKDLARFQYANQLRGEEKAAAKPGAAPKVGTGPWLAQQHLDDWARTADRNDPKNWSGGKVGQGTFQPPPDVLDKIVSEASATAKGEQPWPPESMDMLAIGTIYGQANSLSRLPRTGVARNQYETTLTHRLEEKFGGDPTKPADDPANQRARELGNAYMMVNQQRVMAAGAAARSGANAALKINTAAAELDKAAQLVVDASEGVPRTELYDFNRLIEMARTRTGDPKVVQLGLAINNLFQAYGRLANPFGTGTHDIDKKLIEAQINAGLSKHQMKGAVDQILLEGSNLSGAAMQGINRTLQGLTPLPEGAAEALPGGTAVYRAEPEVPRQYLPEDQSRVKPAWATGRVVYDSKGTPVYETPEGFFYGDRTPYKPEGTVR